MAVQINVAANQAALVQSIQAGVQAYNQRFASQNQINLQVNARGFSQPLGRITGDVKDFEAALAASNARVIAFGASTAVLGGVIRSFKGIAEVTIEVEKNLADINRVFGLSTESLQKFSSELFNVSKLTASSFKDASQAALEFSRQGLKAEEVIQRTTDALTLSRLAGLNVANSIEALTSTVNGFKETGISTTEVLNKLVAVEQSYAVSAGDLAEALSRTGLAAQEAGVNIDQLNALVTAAQEKTARGGAVIGNALKTIFTRIQSRDTLDALESYNILVRDAQGNTLPAISILQNFAKAYQTLGDVQKNQLSQQVAGIYQVNILKAVLSDLNSTQSAYAGALIKGANATNEAQLATAQLNQTLDALLSQTSTVAQQFANNVGKITFEPLAKEATQTFKSLFEGLNDLIEGEGIGSTFARGFLKGIRNIIAGPGAIGAFFVLFKLIQNSFTYLTQALPQIVGITTQTQNRKNIEQAILQILQQQGSVAQALEGQMGNQTAQAQLLLQIARQQTAEYQRQQQMVSSLAPVLAAQGVTAKGQAGLRVTRSDGYLPTFYEETSAKAQGASSKVKAVEGVGKIGGKSFVANNEEIQIPNFAGTGETAVIPTYGGGIRKAIDMIGTGKSGSILNRGFVPNFARSRSLSQQQINNLLFPKTYEMEKGTTKTSSYKISIDKLSANTTTVGNSEYVDLTDQLADTGYSNSSQNKGASNGIYDKLFGEINFIKFLQKDELDQNVNSIWNGLLNSQLQNKGDLLKNSAYLKNLNLKPSDVASVLSRSLKKNNVSLQDLKNKLFILNELKQKSTTFKELNKDGKYKTYRKFKTKEPLNTAKDFEDSLNGDKMNFLGAFYETAIANKTDLKGRYLISSDEYSPADLVKIIGASGGNDYIEAKAGEAKLPQLIKKALRAKNFKSANDKEENLNFQDFLVYQPFGSSLKHSLQFNGYIPNFAVETLLPGPKAIRKILSNQKKKKITDLDFDGTISENQGNIKYLAAKTQEERDAVLNKYFRNEDARMADIQNSPLTSFGAQLLAGINNKTIDPNYLGIMTASDASPRLMSWINKKFRIPKKNIKGGIRGIGGGSILDSKRFLAEKFGKKGTGGRTIIDDLAMAHFNGYIPNFADDSFRLPRQYYRDYDKGILNNSKIPYALRNNLITKEDAERAGYKPSDQIKQEKKQEVLQRVFSSGFKRIGISGIGKLPSSTTTSETNPFAKNFERLALEKAKKMFATNNIVFASNYEKGGIRFHGAPTNTRIDALEDNLTGPVIEMKSGDTTSDAKLRTKFTEAKNELIEMWHNEMPKEKIDNIVRSIGGRPEYLFYNADKEVKRGTEQIIQASDGFIPNFAKLDRNLLRDMIKLNLKYASAETRNSLSFAPKLFDKETLLNPKKYTDLVRKFIVNLPLGSRTTLMRGVRGGGDRWEALMKKYPGKSIPDEEINKLIFDQQTGKADKFIEQFMSTHLRELLSMHQESFLEGSPIVSTSTDEKVADLFAASLLHPAGVKRKLIGQKDFKLSRIINQRSYRELKNKYGKQKVKETILQLSKLKGGKGIGFDIEDILREDEELNDQYSYEKEIAFFEKGFMPNFGFRKDTRLQDLAYLESIGSSSSLRKDKKTQELFFTNFTGPENSDAFSKAGFKNPNWNKFESADGTYWWASVEKLKDEGKKNKLNQSKSAKDSVKKLKSSNIDRNFLRDLIRLNNQNTNPDLQNSKYFGKTLNPNFRKLNLFRGVRTKGWAGIEGNLDYKDFAKLSDKNRNEAIFTPLAARYPKMVEETFKRTSFETLIDMHQHMQSDPNDYDYMPLVSTSISKLVARVYSGRKGFIGEKRMNLSRVLNRTSLEALYAKYGEEKTKDYLFRLTKAGRGKGLGLDVNDIMEDYDATESRDAQLKQFILLNKGFIPNFSKLKSSLSVQQLAAISDEALDKAYGYGRSVPSKSFGWQANIMSAAYAKNLIENGETNIEKIADAVHNGWNVTARKFVDNPDQFEDTEKLKNAGKLEAKIMQRKNLMNKSYASLPEQEKEKDRVVARALLEAIRKSIGNNVSTAKNKKTAYEGFMPNFLPVNALKQYKKALNRIRSGDFSISNLELANGFFFNKNKKVLINKSLKRDEASKTLSHEFFHAIVDGLNLNQKLENTFVTDDELYRFGERGWIVSKYPHERRAEELVVDIESLEILAKDPKLGSLRKKLGLTKNQLSVISRLNKIMIAESYNSLKDTNKGLAKATSGSRKRAFSGFLPNFATEKNNNFTNYLKLKDKIFKNITSLPGVALDGILGTDGKETAQIIDIFLRNPEYLAAFLGKDVYSFVNTAREKGFVVSNELSKKLARLFFDPYKKSKSKGFIPNFAADYINQVMNLESNMSGNKAILDTQTGPFPFIRNSSQPNFAAAISDHGGLNNALGDSLRNQKNAGLMNKGYVPNFAPLKKQLLSFKNPSSGVTVTSEADLTTEAEQKLYKAINDLVKSFVQGKITQDDLNTATNKLIKAENLTTASEKQLNDFIEKRIPAEKKAAQAAQQSAQEAAQVAKEKRSQEAQSRYNRRFGSSTLSETAGGFLGGLRGRNIGRSLDRGLGNLGNNVGFQLGVPILGGILEESITGGKDRSELSPLQRFGGTAASGILTGISTGAAIGSAIPVIGTAAGAAAGAIIGFANAALRARTTLDDYQKQQQQYAAKSAEIGNAAETYIRGLTNPVAPADDITKNKTLFLMSEALSKIDDPEAYSGLIAAGNDVVKLQQVLANYYKRTSIMNLAKSLPAQAKSYQEAYDKKQGEKLLGQLGYSYDINENAMLIAKSQAPIDLPMIGRSMADYSSIKDLPENVKIVAKRYNSFFEIIKEQFKGQGGQAFSFATEFQAELSKGGAADQYKLKQILKKFKFSDELADQLSIVGDEIAEQTNIEAKFFIQKMPDIIAQLFRGVINTLTQATEEVGASQRDQINKLRKDLNQATRINLSRQTELEYETNLRGLFNNSSGRQKGGIIKAQSGILVPGFGEGDIVPAMLEPGEIVINKKAVDAYGIDNLLNLNDSVPRFGSKKQRGGFIGSAQRLQTGGNVQQNNAFAINGIVTAITKLVDNTKMFSSAINSDFLPPLEKVLISIDENTAQTAKKIESRNIDLQQQTYDKFSNILLTTLSTGNIQAGEQILRDYIRPMMQSSDPEKIKNILENLYAQTGDVNTAKNITQFPVNIDPNELQKLNSEMERQIILYENLIQQNKNANSENRIGNELARIRGNAQQKLNEYEKTYLDGILSKKIDLIKIQTSYEIKKLQFEEQTQLPSFGFGRSSVSITQQKNANARNLLNLEQLKEFKKFSIDNSEVQKTFEATRIALRKELNIQLRKLTLLPFNQSAGELTNQIQNFREKLKSLGDINIPFDIKNVNDIQKIIVELEKSLTTGFKGVSEEDIKARAQITGRIEAAKNLISQITTQNAQLESQNKLAEIQAEIQSAINKSYYDRAPIILRNERLESQKINQFELQLQELENYQSREENFYGQGIFGKTRSQISILEKQTAIQRSNIETRNIGQVQKIADTITQYQAGLSATGNINRNEVLLIKKLQGLKINSENIQTINDAENLATQLKNVRQYGETINPDFKRSAVAKEILDYELQINRILNSNTTEIEKQNELLKLSIDRKNLEFYDRTSMRQGFRSGFDELRDQADTIGRKLGHDIPIMFTDGMTNALMEVAKGTATIGDAFRDMAINFGQQIMQQVLNAAIGRVVSSIGFNLLGSQTGGVIGKQNGGIIRAENGAYIPGNRTGDRNLALLEDGEYVLNREAVAAIGVSNLDSLNYGMAPRFQSGGGYNLLAEQGFVGDNYDYTGKLMQDVGPTQDINMSDYTAYAFEEDEYFKKMRQTSIEDAQRNIQESYQKKVSDLKLMTSIIGAVGSVMLSAGMSAAAAGEAAGEAAKAGQAGASGGATAISEGANITREGFKAATPQLQEGLDKALKGSNFGLGRFLQKNADYIKFDGKTLSGLVAAQDITKFTTGQLKDITKIGDLRGIAGLNKITSVFSQQQQRQNIMRSIYPSILNSGSDLFRSNYPGRQTGGLIGFNSGGFVPYGSRLNDTIPALLTGGEYVMNNSAVKKYGLNTMNTMNSGSAQSNGPVNSNTTNNNNTNNSTNISINIDKSGRSVYGASTSSYEQNDIVFSKEMARQLNQFINVKLVDEKRYNGKNYRKSYT